MIVHTRQVRAEDGPALLAVRATTRENPFSLEALAAAGINAESLASGIRAGTLAGWLSQAALTGEVVGFCLTNLIEAELWVVAVLPTYERRGLGRELLARSEALLWAAGHATAWLWTSTDRSSRAYSFYVAAGWQEEAEREERLYLRKARPNQALRRAAPAIIETPRLLLRRMTPDDVPALLRTFGDPEVMRYYPAPFDETRMQDWVDWNQRSYTDHGYGLWALTLRATDELIGDCGLVNQRVDGVPEIEVGYHLRRDLWGQGLATEAALGCLGHGFASLDCRRFVSLIHPQNMASRRVAEKIGMTLERKTEWKNKPTCIYAIEGTAAHPGAAANSFTRHA